MTNEPTDDQLMDAFMNLFGDTPDTVEGKAAQINIALDAGDAVTAAAVVFDQARECGVPVTRHDEKADALFPYPDLAPFGQHGLQQMMEALEHLGLKLIVVPAA